MFFCQCRRCDKLWYGRKHFLRHTTSCDQAVTQSFAGGIFKNQPNIFQKLEDIGIFVPRHRRHCPFYCCHDFESILSQDDSPENGERLSFTFKHISLSVGIASNIPNFEDLICYIPRLALLILHLLSRKRSLSSRSLLQIRALILSMVEMDQSLTKYKKVRH